MIRTNALSVGRLLSLPLYQQLSWLATFLFYFTWIFFLKSYWKKFPGIRTNSLTVRRTFTSLSHRTIRQRRRRGLFFLFYRNLFFKVMMQKTFLYGFEPSYQQWWNIALTTRPTASEDMNYSFLFDLNLFFKVVIKNSLAGFEPTPYRLWDYCLYH